MAAPRRTPLAAALAVALCACVDGGAVTAGPDVPDADTVETPRFVVGTMPAERYDAAAFVPIEHGDDVPVVLGRQGLYMIVLAVRQRDAVHAPVRLDIGLVIDGVEAASLETQPRGLIALADGWSLWPHIFFVVDRLDLIGREAVLTLRAEDDDRHAVTVERRVRVVYSSAN